MAVQNSDQNATSKTDDKSKTDKTSTDVSKDLRDIYVSSGLTEAQIKNAQKWGSALGKLPLVNDSDVDEKDPEIAKGGAYKYGDVSVAKSGVLGMPFQFTSNTDPRAKNEKLGRIYKKNVAANMPAVIFQVGRPLFMDSAVWANNTALKGTMEKIIAIQDEAQREGVFAALGATGKLNTSRYYSFQDDMQRYYDYVNTMCRFTAIKMGIGGKTHTPSGQKYFQFDVRKLKNDSFWKKAIGQSNYVAVYADAQGTNSSESGSNTTGDSMLASAIKKGGEMKREADFLFGSDSSAKLDKMSETNYNEAVSSLTKDFVDPTRIFSRINTAAQTIFSGGNILFPEIWKDSSYRKSYNIEMKFHSPYGDPESVFMNVYVPFFHIFCMAMPRQNSKQGYIGPFLLKCYSKGWFNCDLGMIESIEVKKGGSGNDGWTANNFPTQMDVTISIKDLYPTLMMNSVTRGFSSILFSNNTGLIEYLNMMAGVELHGIHAFENWEVAAKMALGQLINAPGMVDDFISQTIYSTLKSVSVKMFGDTM